jgi:hypothetical protein
MRCCVIVLFGVLTCTTAATAHDNTTWTLTLLQDFFGRTGYRQCTLHGVTSQGEGSIESRCVWNAIPQGPDQTARRKLTTQEIETLQQLARASDLYSGGHTGLQDRKPLISTSGMFETLKVYDGAQWVVLVTQGNPTFQNGGPRLRLLGQLYVWLDELKQAAEKRSQR